MVKQIPNNPFLFGIFIIKQHKIWAIIAILCVLTAVALDRFTVVVLQNLTNAIATPVKETSSMWFWGLLWPSLIFISGFFWRGSGFSGMRLFTNFRATAYKALFKYLSYHSKNYFNNRFAGALTNKISNAVDGSQFLFEKILWRFLPLFVGIVWYTLFAGASNVLLGVIVGVWSAFFLSINAFFALKMQPYSVVSAEAQSTLKGKIVDSLSNISLVHEYAFVSGEHEYITTYILKQFKAGLKQWLISEWVLVANGIFLFIFMFLMIGSAIYFFQNHIVSVGVVVMVVTIVGDMSYQLIFIGQELRDATGFYGQIEEGLNEILQEHMITEKEHASDLVCTKGSVSFNNVSFEYENTKVFSDFSLHIKGGEKIGLVGRSGAGKTTFVSLLLRHFDVQKGIIEIDEQNIQDITLESLRRAIAFVPQDTSLFHRSIFENIRYSNPHATAEDVVHAAKLAQAHHFIEKLPDSYETVVGERGVKLSGGQRQRIAIARAFLKNAPILILDEATSSLDSESEQAIQEALNTLMKDRTVIAIAHRLSTLKQMDRIVIIEEGTIVEDGNPQELLTKEHGRFKRMWEHQIKGFIIDE